MGSLVKLELGDISVLNVILNLIRRGWEVFLSTQDSVSDLLRYNRRPRPPHLGRRLSRSSFTLVFGRRLPCFGDSVTDSTTPHNQPQFPVFLYGLKPETPRPSWRLDPSVLYIGVWCVVEGHHWRPSSSRVGVSLQLIIRRTENRI